MNFKKPYPVAVGRRYVRRFGLRLRSRPEYQVWPRYYNPLEYIERHGRLQSAARQIKRSICRAVEKGRRELL